MARHNWFLIVNASGDVLAVYGSALADEATTKARELNKLGAVALRLVATSKRPHVGDKLGKQSLSIRFEEDQ